MIEALVVLLILLLIISLLPLDGQAKNIAYVAVAIGLLLWVFGRGFAF